MNQLTKSYLSYTRGETKFSPWAILKPLGLVGSLVIKTSQFLYDHGIFISEEMPLPVISIGNITTGGTNKTPFVEYVTRHFCSIGLKPGIISRGYGGKTSQPVVILNGNADRNVVSDEPLLLSGRLPDVPIAVSRDRCADVKALLKYAPDVVIADDAFQHRRMGRDLDIVLVDAICPFGNGSVLPIGTLREVPCSLSRAHIVVISKSDQVSTERLADLKKTISQWVPEEHIFYSKLGAPQWLRWTERGFMPCETDLEGKKLTAFSGIGNPKSFYRTVKSTGNEVISVFEFKDHHRYTAGELNKVEAEARKLHCDALCCTEKDIYNLPSGYVPQIPLYVPRIMTQIDEERRFWKILAETMRPQLVVASNGYGEDAMGVKLALKIRNSFPSASVGAFPLVGEGALYKEQGIKIYPPLSYSPTGGIIKYHLRDLVKEIRAGLLSHICDQLRCWEKIRSRCRTVLCVGDAYLLCNTVLGQSKKALLVATAKTQFISGHWRLESFLFRWGAKKVWTRDDETAAELKKNKVNAVFAGNPIMDLVSDNIKEPMWGNGRRILLLPGSRSRAYKNVRLLLDSMQLISHKCEFSAILVAAPSLEIERLVQSAQGWNFDGRYLSREHLRIMVTCCDVADAARGAELLLGFAGTANQVCAGMGIPVLSVKEKGKFVQKKLLGDAELLVDPTPESLAEAALDLLNNPCKLADMSRAGKERLGRPGALDSVVCYAAENLGWQKKCRLYEKLKKTLL